MENYVLVNIQFSSRELSNQLIIDVQLNFLYSYIVLFFLIVQKEKYQKKKDPTRSDMRIGQIFL